MGIAIRTAEAIDLNLAPPMWKLLVVRACLLAYPACLFTDCSPRTQGQELSLGDLSEIESELVNTLEWWKQATEHDLMDSLEYPATIKLYGVCPVLHHMHMIGCVIHRRFRVFRCLLVRTLS